MQLLEKYSFPFRFAHYVSIKTGQGHLGRHMMTESAPLIFSFKVYAIKSFFLNKNGMIQAFVSLFGEIVSF